MHGLTILHCILSCHIYKLARGCITVMESYIGTRNVSSVVVVSDLCFLHQEFKLHLAKEGVM